MPRPYRRILFWGCILLFLVTAPLLVLHTAGYRYNWERGKIQETGVLILDYQPKSATVLLNGVRRGARAPIRFSGLTPGRYTIAIQKEGFIPWEKRLWIEPSKTTFAQHMMLWKKEITPTIVSKDVPSRIIASPDNKLLAIVSQKKPETIRIVHTAPNESDELLTLPPKSTSAVTNVQWSPRAKRLFVETAKREQFIFTLDGSGAPPIALRRFVQSALTRVLWNTSDDDRIYGYRRTGLRQGYTLAEIDLFRGVAKPSYVTMEKEAPYSVEDDLLYRVEDGALIIAPFLPSRALERRLPLPLPTITKAQFLSGGPDAVLTLFDPDQNRLLLIDKETRTLYPIQETIDGVSSSAWSPLQNRLVWTNGKELWLLDLERSTRELMVAESASGGKKIQDIAWASGNEYVFYTTSGAVKVIEVDNRDNRNRKTLATIPEQKGLWVASDGSTLWTTSQYAKEKGLLSLTITER